MKRFLIKTHDNVTREEIQNLLINTEVEEI